MIKLIYFNEIFCKIETDIPTKHELIRLFSVREPNFYFSPKYRSGIWDGYCKLFLGQYLYVGLIPFVKKFASLQNIEVIDKTNILPENNDIKEHTDWIKKLNLPFTPYDYQIQSFNNAIHYKKLAIISTTSSGKSLIIYMLARYMQQHKKKNNKIFIIVPSKVLVKQMYDDFNEYSANDNWNVEDNCTKISSDYKKDFSKDIIITTYQSMVNNTPDFYQNIEGVILDECQGIQSYSDKKSKCLHKIFDQLVNARYRFGLTGTEPEETLYKLTILKYFVNHYVASTYNKLLKEKRISNFNINVVQLNYYVNERKTYQDELKFIYDSEYRNEFLKKLLLKNKGHNQLLLFTSVKKHSMKIYDELIKDDRFKDFKILFLDKDSKEKYKDEVKEIIANNNNVILLATYKLLGTGWSVKNLYHIIFAAPLKSKQTVLQAIGRGLRLLSNTDKVCNIWDIVDKFLYNNILYVQSTKRMKHYISEKFKINKFNINKTPDLE